MNERWPSAASWTSEARSRLAGDGPDPILNASRAQPVTQAPAHTVVADGTDELGDPAKAGKSTCRVRR